MAEAKICDRCKKVYPAITERQKLALYAVGESRLERIESRPERVDLCGECYEKLTRFMEVTEENVFVNIEKLTEKQITELREKGWNI